MCRALKVLCAAPGRERLAALKRAAVAAHWELIGGAATGEELEAQVVEHRPDVVVLDAELGVKALGSVRRAGPGALIVSVGRLAGADAEVEGLDDVRQAIVAGPPPGGPVRR